MDAIREYAFSIIAVSLICAILTGILQNPIMQSLTRMICGMAITVMMASTLLNLDLSFPGSVTAMVSADAASAAEEGSAMAQEALASHIIRETQAYIQNKAEALNADITVEIRLSEESPPVPESAVICGHVTPYAKQQIQRIFQTELGIAKERLEWTG